jgi:hypothetical protein
MRKYPKTVEKGQMPRRKLPENSPKKGERYRGDKKRQSKNETPY